MTMTKPQLHPALSISDAKVLNAVFDPESSPEAPRISVDPSLPPDAHITNAELLLRLRDQEIAAVRIVESCSSRDQTVKEDVYQSALSILDAVIAEHPTYASAWNNRAQLLRWRCGDRSVLITASTTALSDERLEARRTIMCALDDLSTVIALASPASRDGAVSAAQGKLLAQAWTQRAAIFWGAAKDLGTSGTIVIPRQPDDVRVVEWETWDKVRFEEEGSKCFFMAGLYGSEVGRAMAVLSNPTAKLCGSIVKEAMKRERCAT